ncbi:hypothetical protein [Thermococcus sp. JdF3]|uniref:hypothetical protein n=1 Tax=Thermococcus sp. JdF3 TaxID=1638258 RepID=UPI00143B1100|nr:hypothetical protein [Thermococcus sp. JdF3]NJE02169.1 hypothetical protein [Thermococcus sp. JdF3]
MAFHSGLIVHKWHGLFYLIYGFVVDWLGLAEARLIFAPIIPGAGVLLKVGELLAPLGDVLKLKHIEAMLNPTRK